MSDLLGRVEDYGKEGEIGTLNFGLGPVSDSYAWLVESKKFLPQLEFGHFPNFCVNTLQKIPLLFIPMISLESKMFL